jgi:hypothetical protein
MRREQGPRILYIPDTQIIPDEDISHVEWAARYAAAKRPDAIVLAGDWYDMHSLSSYDDGRMGMEGRRYQDDIDAGDAALGLFDKTLRRHTPRSYKPRRVVTIGNHENRIQRAIDGSPKLEGKLSMSDLSFRRYGWVEYGFLEPVRVYGVTFAHYFPLGPHGNVTNGKNGAPSARAQVQRMMTSCVAGHRQGLDVANLPTPLGIKRGVIAGSYYQRNEGYLTPMGNSHWRGVLMLNDLRPETGYFDLCEVSLDYLKRVYG